jgi:hypothetical protein
MAGFESIEVREKCFEISYRVPQPVLLLNRKDTTN